MNQLKNKLDNLRYGNEPDIFDWNFYSVSTVVLNVEAIRIHGWFFYLKNEKPDRQIQKQ